MHTYIHPCMHAYIHTYLGTKPALTGQYNSADITGQNIFLILLPKTGFPELLKYTSMC